jgi:glycosyltransferase involved in cell wall biosynthesis
LRTGFAQAKGDIVVIQDADLEYDPCDIVSLIQPILNGRADVVFGSRFHGEAERVHLFCHRFANAILTLLFNFMTNLNLSDMECDYKAFRK